MNLIRVTDVKPVGDYKLRVCFDDGLSGVLDFSTLLTGRVFSVLKEADLFRPARVCYGTIVWDGDIDMAPEYLHSKLSEQVAATGR